MSQPTASDGPPHGSEPPPDRQESKYAIIGTFGIISYFYPPTRVTARTSSRPLRAPTRAPLPTPVPNAETAHILSERPHCALKISSSFLYRSCSVYSSLEQQAICTSNAALVHKPLGIVSERGVRAGISRSTPRKRSQMRGKEYRKI